MSLTLNDFGYRHNRGALLSNVERPLLIVLCDHNGQRPFSHVADTGGPDLDYYRDRFFSDASFLYDSDGNVLIHCVNQLFREMSLWRFAFKPTTPPVVLVRLNAAEAALGLPSRRAKILERLVQDGLFDFAPYMHPGSSMVMEMDLSIICLDTDSVSGNGQTGVGVYTWPKGSGQVFDGHWNTLYLAVAVVGDDPSIELASHELVHGLANDGSAWLGIDLYSTGGALHDQLSLMGPSNGGPGDRRTYHLDPWHKLLFGWHEPRIVELQSHRGPLILMAIGTNDPARCVILHARGPLEYFILEYRSPSAPASGAYDRSVASEGMAIWHVKTDTNPKVIYSASMPDGKSLPALGGTIANTGFQAGGRTLWGVGTVTPSPVWLDATSTGVRFAVRWFEPGASSIIVDVLDEDARPPISSQLQPDRHNLEALWVDRLDRLVWAHNDVFEDSGRWQTPRRLSGQGTTAESLVAPASDIAAVTRFNGRMDVFWVGTDGAIWWSSLAPGSPEWSPVSAITPPSVADGTSVIRVVSRHEEHLDVFWSRADGTLMSIWCDAHADGGAWAKHEFALTLPGQVLPASVGAVSAGPELMAVMWIDPSDRAMYARVWRLVERRPRWQLATSVVPARHIRADTTIAAACKEFGEFDIFWVGPDGTVRTLYYAQSAWEPHFEHTISEANGAAPGCYLSACPLDRFRIDVYWVDPNAKLRWVSGVRYPQGGPWDAVQTIVGDTDFDARQPISSASRLGVHRDVLGVTTSGVPVFAWWDRPGAPFKKTFPPHSLERPGAGAWQSQAPFPPGSVRPK